MRNRKSMSTFLLIVLCAALSFGGSFTCKGEQNSDRFTQP